MVKKQITEFLAAYPQSPFHDNLHAIIGDIFFQEDNFVDALAFYKKIKHREFQERTLYKQLHCLYELKKFEEVVAIGLPFFKEDLSFKAPFREEALFLLSESLFKQLISSSDPIQRKKLALEIKPFYESFSSERYKDLALFPLAEIYKILNEYPQASSLYLSLAEKYPEKAEDFLFQAASIQLLFDKSAAIETYGKIYNLNGSKAPLAAYNQFVLLFQEKKYNQFISLSPSIEEHIAPEKKSLFHFWLGRSYFNIGDFSDATLFLKKYVEEEKGSSDFKKSAFLMLITCAQKSNDNELFEHVLHKLSLEFPKDLETSKALLLHADNCLKEGKLAQAVFDLNQFIANFPASEEKETVMYNKALILSQMQAWEESKQAFLSFAHEFPCSSYAESVWNHVLNCSIQDLKNSPPDKQQEKKEQFASDLETALKNNDKFKEEESSNYRFLLAKTYFELNKYKESLQSFQNYLEQYPEHASVGEGYLLTALCYQKLGYNPEMFVVNAEKALNFTLSNANKGSIHLQLFNSYLELGDLEKGADHLFASYILEKHPIQFDNQLWLTNYYFSMLTSNPENSFAYDRASALFEDLLKIKGPSMKLAISPEEAFLEVEALKFAHILPLDKRIAILASLTDIQGKNPLGGWKFYHQALFELGSSYVLAKDFQKALTTYDRLIRIAPKSTSYFSCAASLEKARVLLAQFKSEKQEDFHENNPKIISVLNTLKDLQIQKNIHSEPIHLEAALEYADMRSLLSQPEARIETALFFLNRLKTDFLPQEDLASQDYHTQKEFSPEKNALYQNYMKAIEGEILRLEALLSKKNKHFDEAREKEELALCLLQEVLLDKTITPYLRNRVQTNLQGLGN
jgi:tetratricopeptide (TPR) repeat protein